MTESIFSRVKRMVSGSVEDMVDTMERSGGATVMRQAIREVDQVVAEAKNERNLATAKRLQAVRQQRMYAERLEDMQEKAQYAMNEGREDLAEAALHRQMDFEAQKAKLAEVEIKAAEQERDLEESLASLEMRKAHLEEELKHFEAARADADLESDNPHSKGAEAVRRVERAETAFTRAMGGAGGTTDIAKGEHIKKVAEIDTMRKQSEIEARMEALRKKAG